MTSVYIMHSDVRRFFVKHSVGVTKWRIRFGLALKLNGGGEKTVVIPRKQVVAISDD